jgi:hypothetical protein
MANRRICLQGYASRGRLRDRHAAGQNEPGDRSGGRRPGDSARSDESSRHSRYLQADADQLVTIEPKPGWIRTWQVMRGC